MVDVWNRCKVHSPVSEIFCQETAVTQFSEKLQKNGNVLKLCYQSFASFMRKQTSNLICNEHVIKLLRERQLLALGSQCAHQLNINHITYKFEIILHPARALLRTMLKSFDNSHSQLPLLQTSIIHHHPALYSTCLLYTSPSPRDS